MNETQLLEGLAQHPEWPHALEITDTFNAEQRADFVGRLAGAARSIAERIEEDSETQGGDIA